MDKPANINYAYVLKLSFVSVLGGLLFEFDIAAIRDCRSRVLESFGDEGQSSEGADSFEHGSAEISVVSKSKHVRLQNLEHTLGAVCYFVDKLLNMRLQLIDWF